MTSPAPTPLAAFARRRRFGTVLPVPVARHAWQPGQDGRPNERHSELFTAPGDATGAALALAFAQAHLRGQAADPVADYPDERPWLWVQDAAALRLGGRPYRPGLPSILRHRLIHVVAKTPEDALFALEEGLRCRDLAFVVGEIAGNPRALSLTAQRRLSLVAEKHGVPLWLVRVGAERDLSSARQRWSVRAAPSLPPRWNAQAPGAPAWRAELFRARNHPPGEWILRNDGPVLTAEPPRRSPDSAPDHGDLAAPAGDRPLAAG